MRSSETTNFFALADARRRMGLLAGASGLAIGLMMAGSDAATARALNGGDTGAVSAPNIAADAAAQAAQQAAAAAAQTQQSLARAARAVQDMQSIQAAARAAAAAAQVSATAPVAVPNGLGAGGLLPGGGWIGANAPTQGSDGKGQTEVNIRQTTQQAILNWQSFNIGARTTLTFDQQGRADWVALNRVDSTTGPSQILGNIKADGHVYVINQSGIIFGGNSQINVGSLIASTAQMVDPATIFSAQAESNYVPSFAGAGEGGVGSVAGKIFVEAGAQIATHAPASVTAGGGYVMLLGSAVTNAGAISAPKGQVALAAGRDFLIRPGLGTDTNQYATTRGNEIVAGSWSGTPGTAGTWTAGGGAATNSGMALAQQGDITLTGGTIVQDGLLLSTTSVNQRGSIHLLNSANDAGGSVTLTANSVAAILPELNSTETALDSQRDGLIAASQTANLLRAQANLGRFDNLSVLADRQDQSRIEIVTGGSVTFKGGSYTAAQGGQIAVSARTRIVTENGATLDASGIRSVALTMESNNLNINIQGNELRDSPQNRDESVLKSQNVWIDLRSLTLVPKGTGGYDTDRYYTPGGLIEVGGYLANTRHTIGEWSALGGTITLSANEVVVQKGSVFDISGGSLDYAGGYIRSTNIIGSDGRRYSIDQAPANLTYVNFAGGFRRTHHIQGQEDERLTEIWTTIFDRGRTSLRWEDGYTVGRDAGALVLATPTSIFEGTILADIVHGKRQINARPAGMTDGYKLTQTTAPLAGTLAIGKPRTDFALPAPDWSATATNVIFSNTSTESRVGTVSISADRVNGFGLGGLIVVASNSVTVEDALTLAPGGAIDFVASKIDVKSGLTAPGGRVSLRSSNDDYLQYQGKSLSGSITLHEQGFIDTRGLWTNAVLDPANLSGLAYQNGGAVLLRAGTIDLRRASRINTSSGGALSVTRKLSGGAAGDVSILSTNALKLDGAILSRGYTHGGALTIQSGGNVQIGTQPVAGAFNITPDFFRQGFSSYTIIGIAGVTVAKGTAIEAVQPVYRYASAAADTLTTGADPAAAFVYELPPLYWDDSVKGISTQRAGAEVNLWSGVFLDQKSSRPGGAAITNILYSDVAPFNGQVTIGEGASITVDPGAAIRLLSDKAVTVNGTLTAHGGDISLRTSPWAVRSGTTTPVNQTILVSAAATLDVSAQAHTARDDRGRLYGLVPDGGSILIGGAGVRPDDNNPQYDSAYAAITIAKGATLNASGTSAQIDMLTGERVTVASDGGSININTYQAGNTLRIGGTLIADAGGAGAQGGTLALIVEAPIDPANPDQPASISGFRSITVGGALNADRSLPTNTTITAEQIAAGGFDVLKLYARTSIIFNGNVNLDLSSGRAIELSASQIGNLRADGIVNVAAPYVLLGGMLPINGYRYPSATENTLTGNRLTVAAELIDFRNVSRSVFQATEMLSRGDIRILDTIVWDGEFRDTRIVGTTQFTAGQELTLSSRQIYPVTNAIGSLSATNRIAIAIATPTPGDVPDVPQSAFGSLTFQAPTFAQGGVVRVPLGSISVKDVSTLKLLPGSITSVSGAGLTTLYGGTTDGVRYTVDGNEPLLAHVSSGRIIGTSNEAFIGIVLGGTQIDVAEGAVIDVSGGGQLNGAAFISGRGGSVDVLTTPLVNANPANTYSAKGNQVFAIVPGIASTLAASSHNTIWTGNTPQVGQQIEIPPGVPGLPAGKYTMLPAYYALMPGGYRVELGAPLNTWVTGTLALGNGSYLTTGVKSVANTAIRDVLPTHVIVTPGGVLDARGKLGAGVLGTYSQYNQTSYAEYAVSQTDLFSRTRPLLPGDGKFLTMALTQPNANSLTDLSFKGTVKFDRAQGSYDGEHGYYDGTASLEAVGWNNGLGVDIVVTPTAPDARTPYTLYITQQTLDRLNAPNLYIGARPNSWLTGNPGRGMPWHLLPFVTFGSDHATSNVTKSITVESGVTIDAGHLILYANGTRASETIQIPGSIVVENGATIASLGRGVTAPDSRLGFQYHTGGDQGSGRSANGNPGAAALVVSNGWIDFAPASGAGLSTLIVEDGARLYSDGTLGFVASKGVDLEGGQLQIGGRYLSFAVPSLNIGSQTALDAAGGLLPTGLNITQSLLDKLLTGSTFNGKPVPAAESLILKAANSINFYGSAVLDTYDANGKSRLAELVLSAPALYGAGGIDNTVVFRTERLVWSGNTTIVSDQSDSNSEYGGAAREASNKPGAIVTGGAGTGSGRLRFETEQFVLGFPTVSRTDAQTTVDRLILGFSSVDIVASKQISANRVGTLNIFQSANPAVSMANYDAATYAGTGGVLNIVTPLVTADGGANIVTRVGGALSITAPAGGAAPAGSGIVGGSIAFKADSILVDTSIAAPTGLISLTAKNGLALGAHARLDVSGRTLTFFDQERYTWGGEVRLESTHGNIVQNAGGVIDVSGASKIDAQGKTTYLSDDGRLIATATDAAAGSVLFGGALLGGDDRNQNAKGASIDIRAQRIGTGDLSADFAALNTRLSEAGFSGGRAFQFKQGNLVIGDELRANDVRISIDGGSLTVNGTIDASGTRPGSIRLAAQGDLVIGASALLDVHGTKLWIDGYGMPIEASNRGHIELATRGGELRLVSGASFDLSSPDGIARGRVELSAPRLGVTGTSATGATGPANAIGDNIAIQAGAIINISGAEHVAINGTARYANAPADPANANGQVIDQAWLDRIDQDNQAFVSNLYGGNVAGGVLKQAVRDRLGGLLAYGNRLHVRPGVEIVSATPDGDLKVNGNLNLAGYRYGPDANRNPNSAGFGLGEPLRLTLAAGGNLDIKGSISDGFALAGNTTNYTTPVTINAANAATIAALGGVLIGGTSGAATSLPGGATATYVLPFDIDIRAGAAVQLGVALPFNVYVNGNLTLPAWTNAQGYALPGALTLTTNPTWVATTTRRDQRIVLPDGRIYTRDGQALSDGTPTIRWAVPDGLNPVVLPAGTRLFAGTSNAGVAASWNNFPFSGMFVPAGSKLPEFTQGTPGGSVAVRGGAADNTPLRVPAGTSFAVFAGNVTLAASVQVSENTVLPVGAGVVGQFRAQGVDPVLLNADLLKAGHESASIRLVAGADLAAADTRALRPGSTLVTQPGAYLGVVRDVTANPLFTHFHSPGFEFYYYDRPAASGRPELYVLEDWRIPNTFTYFDNGPFPFTGIDPVSGTTRQFRIGEVIPAGTRLVGVASLNFDPHAPLPVLATGRQDPAGPALFTGNLLLNAPLTKIGSNVQTFVIRTGTGDLDLLAGGDLEWKNYYGVYTAGVQTGVPPGFNMPASTTKIFFPDHGGDLLAVAQGDLIGYSSFNAADPYYRSTNVSTWLLRSTGDTAANRYWGVTFGANGGSGFNGLGTLGGGNASILVGGDAGNDERVRYVRGNSTNALSSQALTFAVGATGRVTGTSPSDLTQTGGGDLTVRIGGRLNAGDTRHSMSNTDSIFVDLRGDLLLDAGAIGTAKLSYGQYMTLDPRQESPWEAVVAAGVGGPLVVLGDTRAMLRTRGDLVFGDYGDGGGLNGSGGFLLATGRTSIDQFSAGGNVVPYAARVGASAPDGTYLTGDSSHFSWLLPSQFRVTAGGGSIFNATSGGGDAGFLASLILLPSANGQLELLARGSILTDGRPWLTELRSPLCDRPVHEWPRHCRFQRGGD